VDATRWSTAFRVHTFSKGLPIRGRPVIVAVPWRRAPGELGDDHPREPERGRQRAVESTRWGWWAAGGVALAVIVAGLWRWSAA
jgi:hypothetical protein